MRRVVVTGMGIWSCIGQDLQTVTESLRQGRSGIIFDPKRIEYGLHSGLVGNVPRPDLKPFLPREFRAMMPEDAEYAYMAVSQAFKMADVKIPISSNLECGMIWGNDGNSELVKSIEVMQQEHDSYMVGPYALYNYESSAVNINLGSFLHLTGANFSVGAACASSSHAIGIAQLLIKSGINDIILVGGSCQTSLIGVAADALEAMSLRNDTPKKASRPFDKNRDGMVQSGGAAALVLEEYDHAVSRGATILAEVVGYGFSSNGIEEISMPSADAEYIAMKRALDDAGLQASDIDYVNAHGTSTFIGDIAEAKALTRLFVKENQIINHKSEIINRKPYVSSTKSMTGHENWMAGASEAVYSILMMQNNFVAPNINLENVIDEAKDLNIAHEAISTPIKIVLSNSAGIGGTNSAIILKKI